MRGIHVTERRNRNRTSQRLPNLSVELDLPLLIPLSGHVHSSRIRESVKSYARFAAKADESKVNQENMVIRDVRKRLTRSPTPIRKVTTSSNGKRLHCQGEITPSYLDLYYDLLFEWMTSLIATEQTSRSSNRVASRILN